MHPLTKLLEAALFAASRPLTIEELASLDVTVGEAAVRSALEELRSAYGDGSSEISCSNAMSAIS